MARDTMPVSAWMVEAIAPQPGHTILDLAAGIGDTGYLAAELIEPGGTLITSDFAPEMLAAAQRRAQAKGITNVRFRQMDMNVPLDQPAASLDGVLGRWAFMLVNDGEAALTRGTTHPQARRQRRPRRLGRRRREPVELRDGPDPATAQHPRQGPARAGTVLLGLPSPD